MYQVYNDEYLVHHGVKGMHWGIRRYQNSDGSLTSAGKKRYQKQTYKDVKRALRKSDKSWKSQMSNVSEVLKKTDLARPTPDESKRIDSTFEEYYQRTVDLSKNHNQENREKRESAQLKYYDAQRAAAKRITSDILGKYGEKSYNSTSVKEYVESALERYSGILRPKIE